MQQSHPTQPQKQQSDSRAGEIYLIADDDEFFRLALKTILTKSLGPLNIIDTASLDEAIERLSGTGDVTLALFDLAMPGMESAASLRAVRECFPTTRVAVVSASRRRADILLALEAGAHGYIPKSLGVAEIGRAIQVVREGRIYVPPLMADLSLVADEPRQFMTRSAAPQAGAAGIGLTPRQRDVLGLLIKGMSNKDIARALKLGEGTIKVHVATLFRTPGVTSRSAAAAAGARLTG